MEGTQQKQLCVRDSHIGHRETYAFKVAGNACCIVIRLKAGQAK